jgi:hypothetical protein
MCGQQVEGSTTTGVFISRMVQARPANIDPDAQQPGRLFNMDGGACVAGF